ncbi:hypothetical protein [Aquimarina macrocephali]|nr:hypothetical protein [Aquimarina macrocephali]
MSKIKRFSAYTVTVLPQTLAGIVVWIEDKAFNYLKNRHLTQNNLVC